MLEQLETRTKNLRKIRFETRIKIRKLNHEHAIAQHRAAHATVSQQIRMWLVECCWSVCASAHPVLLYNFGLKSEHLCCLSIFVIYFHFIFKNTHFLMAPKKVTNVEKPKRKIIMTTVKF